MNKRLENVEYNEIYIYLPFASIFCSFCPLSYNFVDLPIEINVLNACLKY